MGTRTTLTYFLRMLSVNMSNDFQLGNVHPFLMETCNGVAKTLEKYVGNLEEAQLIRLIDRYVLFGFLGPKICSPTTEFKLTRDQIVIPQALLSMIQNDQVNTKVVTLY